MANENTNQYPLFSEQLKPFKQRFKELFQPRVLSPKAGYSAEARTFGEKVKDLFKSSAANFKDEYITPGRLKLKSPLASGSLFKEYQPTGAVLGSNEPAIKEKEVKISPTATPTTMSTPTPMPVKTNYPSIAATPSTERPFNKEISSIWGDASNIAHNILARVVNGQTKGENTEYKAGVEVDVPNKTKWDPVKKKTVWNNDPNAPVDQKPDPFTGKNIDSIDRGLFRINNASFFTYLSGKEERMKMYEAGIIDKPHLNWDGLTPDVRQRYWDYMLDPIKNTKMAKIIYDKQGEKAWYASPFYDKE